MKPIPVHKGMDAKIQVNPPTVETRRYWVGVEGIDHRQNMMIPVQKEEWTLAQNQKHGVDQLKHLRDDEEPYPIAVKPLGERGNLAIGI